MTKDKGKCTCINCCINSVMSERHPESAHVSRLFKTMPDIIEGACNLRATNHGANCKDPRYLQALILGFSLALDSIGAPAYITKEPEIAQGLVNKFLEMIAIAAIATGNASVVKVKPHQSKQSH